jgi:hypothetical protein
MTTLAKAASAFVLIAVSTLVSVTAAGQAQPAARGQAAGQPPAQGRGEAAPPPPAAQPGHPSGRLIIWGDVVNFNPQGTPNECTAQSRFRRGERIGFRMTAIDGGSGETENTAVLTAHVTYAGKTVDVPMRFRGGGQPYPPKAYLRAPNEMWTGGWVVPADAPIGMISYTVTATDRFGRKSTYQPFAAIPSQLTIVQ